MRYPWGYSNLALNHRYVRKENKSGSIGIGFRCEHDLEKHNIKETFTIIDTFVVDKMFAGISFEYMQHQLL